MRDESMHMDKRVLTQAVSVKPANLLPSQSATSAAIVVAEGGAEAATVRCAPTNKARGAPYLC